MSVAGRRGGVGGKRRPRGGGGGEGRREQARRRRRGVRPVGGAASSGAAQGGTDGRRGRREGRSRAWAAAHLAGRPPGPPWADSAGQRRSPPPRRRPRSVRARRPRGWVGWGAGRKTALGNVKLRSGIFFFSLFPAAVWAGLSGAKAPSSQQRFLSAGRSALFWEHRLP